jgi:hypothetical protein
MFTPALALLLFSVQVGDDDLCPLCISTRLAGLLGNPIGRDA